MPDLSARCPAAEALDGPPVGGPSIVCRVMQREGAAQDGITEGAGFEHLLVTADPSIVLGFCCGQSSPPISLEREGDRAHYACCPIWQREQERIAAAQQRAWKAPRNPALTSPLAGERVGIDRPFDLRDMPMLQGWDGQRHGRSKIRPVRG